jgi:hypothetical protein
VTHLDTCRDNKETARRAAFPQPGGPFHRWWAGAAAVLPTVWLIVRHADGRILGGLRTHGQLYNEATGLGVPNLAKFAADLTR